MEIGESVAVNVSMDQRLPCGFCGEHHDAHRKDPIELKTIAGSKPAWKRRSMSESDARPVSDLYPDGVRSEVHHCIALSAFCVGLGRRSGSPRDFIPRLNHWLDKGAIAQRPVSTAPGCREEPKKGERAQQWTRKFVAVANARCTTRCKWHIGNHEAHQPRRQVAEPRVQIARIFSEGSNLCETTDQEDVQRRLMDLIAQAENLAFRKTVTYEAPFQSITNRAREDAANAGSSLSSPER